MIEKENSTLTARQQHILKVVVKYYIETGLPVGSKTVIADKDIKVSSATVRHEMVTLEEKGFLNQPHTSAGRLPTEEGYRYFVEKLMEEGNLTSNERLMIQHQFHQARLELDQWMRLSAAVLAHSTRIASLVTSPKIERCKLKHLELINIQDYIALLILVLQEGSVKQQILNLETIYTQDELRTLSHQLTDLWTGKDVMAVKASLATLVGLPVQIANVIIEIMGRVNARKTSDMYHDGLLHILKETELTDSKALEQVVHALEERYVIDQLVSETLNQGGVQIIIGGEGKWHDLSQISIVLSRYGVDNGVSGALGVVGPIRMPYGRAVSIVRYMSRLMSKLMVDLYGSQTDQP